MKSVKDRKGCLMAYPTNNVTKTLNAYNNKIVNEKDLFVENDDFGREKDPHVTILYGFINDLQKNELDNFFKKIHPFKIKIDGIGTFDNEKFCVLKYNIQSDVLNELNATFKKYPHVTDYPDYKPHMTIAYIKKSEEERYKSIKYPIKAEILIDKIIYSGINYQKIQIDLK